MKKILMLLLALMLVFSLTACNDSGQDPAGSGEAESGDVESGDAESGDAGSGEEGGAQTTWDKIQAEGKIVVGLDDTFAPMGFREKGTNELIGFDIDMGEELSQRLGVEFEWLPTEWKGVTGSLNSKKFDAIINGMSITDARKEAIDFTIPYVSAGIGAVVLEDSDINDIEALDGLKIATQTGSSGAEACEEKGYEDVSFYDQYPNAFQDLSIGRMDVIVVDATTATHFIAEKPGEYRLLEGRIVKEDYGIGIRKEDDVLEEKLNEALMEMMEDGSLAALSEKWFGADVIAYQE